MISFCRHNFSLCSAAPLLSCVLLQLMFYVVLSSILSCFILLSLLPRLPLLLHLTQLPESHSVLNQNPPRRYPHYRTHPQSQYPTLGFIRGSYHVSFGWVHFGLYVERIRRFQLATSNYALLYLLGRPLFHYSDFDSKHLALPSALVIQGHSCSPGLIRVPMHLGF